MSVEHDPYDDAPPSGVFSADLVGPERHEILNEDRLATLMRRLKLAFDRLPANDIEGIETVTEAMDEVSGMHDLMGDDRHTPVQMERRIADIMEMLEDVGVQLPDDGDSELTSKLDDPFEDL